MSLSVKQILYTSGIVLAFCGVAPAQNVTRELIVGDSGTVEIINKYGRVGVSTIAAAVTGSSVTTSVSSLMASSTKGVSDSEIKISSGGGRMVITVTASDKQKRIDLVL